MTKSLHKNFVRRFVIIRLEASRYVITCHNLNNEMRSNRYLGSG